MSYDRSLSDEFYKQIRRVLALSPIDRHDLPRHTTRRLR